MITVVDQDEMRWLTRTVVAGAALALALRVMGGMPIDLPMPTHAVGVVDPTCGLTRASMAISRGDFAMAWRFNPAAFVLAVMSAAAAGRYLWGRRYRRWIVVRLRVTPWSSAALGVLFALWWAYQQDNAGFIISTRYP